MSCELWFEDQLMSALPQSPTSTSSRFAEVTNLNQDLTPSNFNLTRLGHHFWQVRVRGLG
jgi:hypothetical protein